MWIDGKSFSITKCDESGQTNTCSEDYKTHYNINFSNDLYQTSFRLPGIYYEKVQNFSYFTMKDLEENTNATITIPQQIDESITISSKDIESVIDARNKLHSVFSIIRDSQNVLQFISIPTLNSDIKTKFEGFK